MSADRLIEGWEVSPRDAAAARDAGAAVLLDCRTPEERAIARIEGALFVPMQEIASRLPELERHADRPVIVFCHHGRRSLGVTEFLRKNGFDDVRSMAGGIERWSIDVDPSVPRY